MLKRELVLLSVELAYEYLLMIWLLIEVPVAGWNVRFSQMDNDLKCTEKGSQEFLEYIRNDIFFLCGC